MVAGPPAPPTDKTAIEAAMADLKKSLESQDLEQIKQKLEPAFSSVCVMGEVSNFRGSGRHWYFTLKEEGAALQCAVWAGQQRFLRHTPKDGQRVVLQGSLNLYVAGGSLTLAITQCELAGVGDLQWQ